MKWLEIIELRSAGVDREELNEKLVDLITEVEEHNREQDVRTFSKAVLNTDFSIHLYHESEALPGNGSTLGLNLAAACREFGLVNHSIWMELNPGKER